MDNRLYCVTLLLKNGYEDINGSGIRILGKIMNSLITHKNKAKKYVYDKTVFHINLEEKNIDAGVLESALM